MVILSSMRTIDTLINFINKSHNIHGIDRYNYSKVIYLGNNIKVEIGCNKCGEWFWQTPSEHKKKINVCKYCNGHKYNTNIFIKMAIIKHGNDAFDYSKIIYKLAKTKIEIGCKKCNYWFWQTPSAHLDGEGCPQCANNVLLNKTIFENKANIIHNYKYDYSLFKYISANTPGIIICPDHGIFLQRPSNHINLKQKCPKCEGNQFSNKKEFIEKAIEIHGHKYDYSLFEYNGSHITSIIICAQHGQFKQNPSNHLNGRGCPKCAHIISKPETNWLDSLEIPQENRQKIIKVGNKIFKIDGQDPNNPNILYEFNGDYWHGNPEIFNPNDLNEIVNKTFGELYNKTIEKKNILEAAGYKVVSIWENDWNKLKA